jgi:hypothetical protein
MITMSNVKSEEDMIIFLRTLHPHIKAISNAIKNMTIADSIEEFNMWMDIAQIESDTVDKLLVATKSCSVLDSIKTKHGDYETVYPNAKKLGII